MRQSFSSSPQQAKVSVGGVTKMESDDEEDGSSDVSGLQEIDPRRLRSHKDQNGNVDKRNFGKGLVSSPQTSTSVQTFCHIFV